VRPRNSEVQRLVSDNSRVRDLFGWSPLYTGPDGLQRGLGKTVEWFRANIGRYENRSRLIL